MHGLKVSCFQDRGVGHDRSHARLFAPLMSSALVCFAVPRRGHDSDIVELLHRVDDCSSHPCVHWALNDSDAWPTSLGRTSASMEVLSVSTNHVKSSGRA